MVRGGNLRGISRGEGKSQGKPMERCGTAAGACIRFPPVSWALHGGSLYHNPTPAGGTFRFWERMGLTPVSPRPPCPCDLSPVSMAEPVLGPTELAWRIVPLDGRAPRQGTSHGMPCLCPQSLPLQTPFLPQTGQSRGPWGGWGAVPGDPGQGWPPCMAALASAQVQGEVLPSSWVKL